MIGENEILSFEKNGYIKIEGLLSKEEAAACRACCHELADRLSKQSDLNAAWGSAINAVPGAEGSKLLHCHNVQFYSAVLGRLLYHPGLTETASKLIRSPNVQLHHNKMFIKPPERGAPFPMHQDYPYFPHQLHSMTACMLHFDDAPEEKGCIRVVPGSHKLGPLPHSSEGGWHLPFEEYRVAAATPIPCKAGDAVFFNYLTIHGSGLNTSNEARTTLLIQFRSPEDRPTEDVHLSRGQGMILAGIDPFTTYMGLEEPK